MSVRGRIHSLLRTRLGVDVVRVSGRPRVLVDADETFQRLYYGGAQRSGTPCVVGRHPRLERHYNLVQLLQMTEGVAGGIAECGCFRGLSSYMMCQYLKREDAAFRGHGVHLFDSFAGLSAPTAADDPGNVPDLDARAGEFAASRDHVARTLEEFPDVAFHQGWIPDCFQDAPGGPWRFVHVDVDLYEPTRDALAYFAPRMSPGGVIVCDDYGYLDWPGARKAVDEFDEAGGVRTFRVSTGQAVIFPDGSSPSSGLNSRVAQ
jgi:hypothetical protein